MQYLYPVLLTCSDSGSDPTIRNSCDQHDSGCGYHGNLLLTLPVAQVLLNSATSDLTVHYFPEHPTPSVCVLKGVSVLFVVSGFTLLLHWLLKVFS